MQAALLKDIIDWDVDNWSQALPFWEPVIDKQQPGAKILAIGERGGGLSLWLALKGFHVICTDRKLPLPQAESLHEKYGVEDKITYRELDIVHADIQGQFDIVILKSVIGGLKGEYGSTASRNEDTRHQAVQNIYKLLKPGGYLLTADNMHGSWLMQWPRKLQNKNNSWHYFTPQEIARLLNSFSSVSTRYFGVFPTRFFSPVLNRIFFFFNKLFTGWLPVGTYYIGFTKARK